MKKILGILLLVLCISTPVSAITDAELIQEQTIQNQIDDIGTKILNA